MTSSPRVKTLLGAIKSSGFTQNKKSWLLVKWVLSLYLPLPDTKKETAKTNPCTAVVEDKQRKRNEKISYIKNDLMKK